MADVVAHVEAFETALAEGNVGAAEAQAAAVDEATVAPADLLASLRDALADGRDSVARALLGRLLEAYRRREADERMRQGRQTLARRQHGGVSTETRRLSAAAGRQATADGARGALFVAASTALRGTIGERQRSRLVGQIEAQLTRETTLTRRNDSAASVVEETDLPAAPRLLAVRPRPKTVVAGGESQVTATVGNVGDESAAAVGLSVSSPLLASTVSAPVGTLAAGERATESVTVPVGEPGRHTVTVELETDDGPVTRTTAVVGTEEAATATAAFDENGNHLIDTPEVQQAILHWQADRPVDALGGVVPTLEDVRQVVRAWSEARLV